MSPEQAPSAEIFLFVKMRRVQSLMSSEVDEYQGMTVFVNTDNRKHCEGIMQV